MANFNELLLNVLDEKGISLKELYNQKLIPLYTYYHFDKYTPSLQNAMSIANYLNISFEYLFELADENNFTEYKYPPENFYKNLSNAINAQNLTVTKLCKDLGFSKNTYYMWQKGRPPRLSNVISLANYLDCKIDDLLK